jgi:hypothetical protein
VEEDTNRFFGAPHGEEGRTGWRILAPRVLVPRVFSSGLRSRVSKSHRRINRGLEEWRGFLLI